MIFLNGILSRLFKILSRFYWNCLNIVDACKDSVTGYFAWVRNAVFSVEWRHDAGVTGFGNFVAIVTKRNEEINDCWTFNGAKH